MANFTPSTFQKDIFDFVLNDSRNAVVSAVAGSGKTTTLLKSLELISDENSVLFLAFNKSIVDELIERVPKKSNIHLKTLHKFGYGTIRKNFDSNLDPLKYRSIVWNVIDFLSGKKENSIDKYKFDEEHLTYCKQLSEYFKSNEIDYSKFVTDVVNLCNLSRLHLVNFDIKPIGVGEINRLSEIHSISNQDGESICAWYLSKLGIFYKDEVDHTDQISLPNILNLPTETYDFVFIDECQDLNSCQRMLMQKALKPNTGRFIAVGDPKQAIYAFAGADHESYEKLKGIPNTIELPLSYTYRCAPQILNLVRHLNPAIIAHPKNRNGKVLESFSYKDLQDGDMVLCRNTFPVVSLCIKLLSEEKKSYIIGSDIGKSLITLIESTRNKTQEFNMENVLCSLLKQKEKMIEKVMSSQTMKKSEASEDSQVVIFSEKIQVIEALSNNIEDPNLVIEKIQKIFADDKKNGICLSTIHKSKGLEAERVFIIHPELIPSKFATLPWQVEQERNLEYVAYTRAKTTLGFINDFDAFTTHKTREIDQSKLKVSKHIGSPGMKMYFELTVTDVRTINGMYGETTVYDLVDKNGNMFCKFGNINDEYLSNNLQNKVSVNSKVSFYGIIKEHSEFRGNKVTKLGKISQY